MISKIYLKEGGHVFLTDSKASRDLGCFYKTAKVKTSDEDLFLEHDGKRYNPDKDDNGFYIALEDFEDDE